MRVWRSREKRPVCPRAPARLRAIIRPVMGRKNRQQRRADRPPGPEFTAESPLEVAGRIVRKRARPARLGWFAAPLRSVVSLVPAARVSANGRAAARQIRAAIMIVGLAIAIGGGTMATALIGMVIAMIGSFFPTPQTTKLRWLASIDALRRPSVQQTTHTVAVVFDGRGVSVSEDGQLLRRTLTTDTAWTLRCRKIDEHLAILLTPEAGASGRITLLAPPPEATDMSRVMALSPSKADLVVRMDTAAMVRVHDAIRPADVEAL